MPFFNFTVQSARIQDTLQKDYVKKNGGLLLGVNSDFHQEKSAKYFQLSPIVICKPAFHCKTYFVLTETLDKTKS